MPSLSSSQKSWLAPPNLYMNTLNIPELITSVIVSVTLTEVWSWSPIVRVRVVLRGTVFVTSAGLIKTLDTGSENCKESEITKGETSSYLDCITGDALVSLISGGETISSFNFSTRKWKIPPPLCPAIYPILSLLKALSLYRATQSKN